MRRIAAAVVIGMLIVPIVAGGVWPAPVRAQGDVDAVRAVVQQWVLQQLGKSGLILVEYTYYGTTWQDSSLGCTTPGETPTPGLVNGYVWTFTFDNMVRYEVHSGYAGTPAVICGAVSIRPDIQLTSYTSSAFSISIPDSWLIYPEATGGAVVFGPTPTTDCALPGMRVEPLGRVASGVTPDGLLDEYLASVGVQDDPALRSAVGEIGRTTRYQTACDDGERGWRVTAFEQYGSAYRIEQWAPVSEFEQWDVTFTNMLDQFTPPGASPASTPTGTETADSSADAVTETPLAPLPIVHLFVGDVFLGTLDDLPGRSVTIIPENVRRYLGFSPDGLWISFIDVTAGELRAMNAADGRSPRRLAQEVDTRFPPAWSPDSARVAYVTDTGTTDDSGAELLAIWTVPAEGGDPEQVARFAFAGDCPAESSDPADVPYAQEAGPNGQDNVLAWLPDGRFLISTRCDAGLAMLNPGDGTLIELGTDLRGGVLASDGTRFAARTDAGLAVLDFTAWQRANLPLGADARQLAWGADGQSLYYSTETLSSSSTLDDPAEQAQGEAIFGQWPVTATVYDLALLKVDLNAATETLIWQGQGRGIGRIAPAPDGSGVLFSVVTASQPFADAFLAQSDSLALDAARPQPVLYWLPATSISARLLAYSGEPAFASITTPTATP